MDILNPYCIDDLLKAHSIMMRGLNAETGEFRSRPVGVVNSEGKVLHFWTLPQYVPSLVNELLDWAENSGLHMLIKSCVFHYEFELIHPFADGNGRLGRMWHTLLLSKWNPMFTQLAIESIIHDNQEKYYEAINVSNEQGESTAFIEFMLSVIKRALKECTETKRKNKRNQTELICKYLKKNDYIMNSDVQKILGFPPQRQHVFCRMR